MSADTLLILTTANQSHYTRLALKSIEEGNLRSTHLLIIDDASIDDTVPFLRKAGVEVITKPRPQGLTHSWNLAYQKFRRSHYRHLFLANNDILIPPGALAPMILALGTYTAIGPLTTRRGAGHQRRQSLRRYFTTPLDETDPKNAASVQLSLSKILGREVKQLPRLNGFFFGLNRDIFRHELGDGTLFRSSCVNVGNEDEFFKRIKGRTSVGVSLRSFIYHFKGVSFRHYPRLAGHTFFRELTWEEAALLGRPWPVR